MEPITATALITALAAGAIGGVTEAGKQAIIDGYTALKSLLKRKFGAQSQVAQSLDLLEASPQSEARKELVKEVVTEVKADQDPEIHRLAQTLLEQIKGQASGEQVIQTAKGNHVAQAAGGSNASVTDNRRWKNED